jgi:sugar/nucleoside kinase (ribokinase family)
MRVEVIGEPWSESDEPEHALRGIEWVHVAPVLRDDFPPETLERIAHGRRLLLDGQGLVRARRLGPLVLDAEFDRSLLRHVSILKLAEEEARAILGEADLEELRGLGVPEVVVTFGARGSLVLTRDTALRVQTRPARGDPTGAGDAFCVAYLSARAGGHRPISAARRASALVSALLSNSLLLGRRGP